MEGKKTNFGSLELWQQSLFPYLQDLHRDGDPVELLLLGGGRVTGLSQHDGKEEFKPGEVCLNVKDEHGEGLFYTHISLIVGLRALNPSDNQK